MKINKVTANKKYFYVVKASNRPFMIPASEVSKLKDITEAMSLTEKKKYLKNNYRAGIEKYKYGITNNIKNRIAYLKKDFKCDFELLALYEFPKKNAVKLEDIMKSEIGSPLYREKWEYQREYFNTNEIERILSDINDYAIELNAKSININLTT